MTVIETQTVGPFGVFFTNQNTQMDLKGHSHTARVTLTYLAVPAPDNRACGFPSFHDTHEAIVAHLDELTAGAFRDATNEEVVRRLFDGFAAWTHEAVDVWGTGWVLLRVTLAVEGVRDRVGHADSTTVYVVERTPEEALWAHTLWRRAVLVPTADLPTRPPNA